MSCVVVAVVVVVGRLNGGATRRQIQGLGAVGPLGGENLEWRGGTTRWKIQRVALRDH